MAETGSTKLRAVARAYLIEEFKNHIDGKWVESRIGERFDNINPADTSRYSRPISGLRRPTRTPLCRPPPRPLCSGEEHSISARAKVLNGAADHLETMPGQFAR